MWFIHWENVYYPRIWMPYFCKEPLEILHLCCLSVFPCKVGHYASLSCKLDPLQHDVTCAANFHGPRIRVNGEKVARTTIPGYLPFSVPRGHILIRKIGSWNHLYTGNLPTLANNLMHQKQYLLPRLETCPLASWSCVGIFCLPSPNEPHPSSDLTFSTFSKSRHRSCVDPE